MAAEEESGQGKAHDPTPRRLEKARERGDVARSQDAQTFAAYLGLAVALALAGSWSALRLGETLRPTLADPEALAGDILGTGGGALAEMLGRVIAASLPLVALPAGLILALLVAQRGIVVAPDKILPKIQRISPIANAGQRFGPSGLVEFAKSVVKIAAVAGVLAVVIARSMDEILASAGAEARSLGPLLAEQPQAVMLGVLLVSAAIAGLDLAWQNHEHLRRNRMTHQELKEEAKSAEGDPHLKAERRSRAREIATQKMMHAVPEADVVVTNPTHVAVALKWDRKEGTAPVCLAKGVDEIALRIRELAEAAGVPIHPDPATARSIHALIEVGREVKPEHYRAVAAAILFADRMRGKARRA